MTTSPNKIFIGYDPDLHTPAAAAVVFMPESPRPMLLDVEVGNVRGEKNREAATAAIEESDAVITRLFARVVSNGTPVRAVGVEAQELYRSGPHKTPNPRDIMFLGHVAGGAWNTAFQLMRRDKTAVYFPAPQAWKGSCPKHIKQGQVFDLMGIEYVLKGGKEKYCVPSLVVDKKGPVKEGAWKHIGDAVGLAVWAGERWFAQQRKNAVLARIDAENNENLTHESKRGKR